MSVDDEGRITKFAENPEPKANLASWASISSPLICFLKHSVEDAKNPESSHDFGKRLFQRRDDGGACLPIALRGFWRDVGTIASYHETSMDLLGSEPKLDIFRTSSPFCPKNASTRPPAYIGPFGGVNDCLVSNGCQVFLVILVIQFCLTDAVIGEEHALLTLCFFLVQRLSLVLIRAIIGENAVVEKNVHVGVLI